MSLGGSKAKPSQSTSTTTPIEFKRLPAVIPQLSTSRGSFINVTPGFDRFARGSGATSDRPPQHLIDAVNSGQMTIAQANDAFKREQGFTAQQAARPGGFGGFDARNPLAKFADRNAPLVFDQFQRGGFSRARGPALGSAGAAGQGSQFGGFDPRFFGPDISPTNTGDLKTLDIEAGLDPSIDRIRDESLEGLRTTFGDVGTRIGQLDELRGTLGPDFINARTADLQRQRAGAARAASRRGVSGPLAALATNPFDMAISQARALARSDILSGELNIQNSIRANNELRKALTGQAADIAQQRMQQELQVLGLTQQTMRDIIGSQLSPALASSQFSKTEGGTPGGGGLPIGKIAGGIAGAFFGGPAGAAAGSALGGALLGGGGAGSAGSSSTTGMIAGL